MKGRSKGKVPPKVCAAIYAAKADNKGWAATFRAVKDGSLDGVDGPFPIAESTFNHHWRKGAGMLPEPVPEGEAEEAADTVIRSVIAIADSERKLAQEKLRDKRMPVTERKRWLAHALQAGNGAADQKARMARINNGGGQSGPRARSSEAASSVPHRPATDDLLTLQALNGRTDSGAQPSDAAQPDTTTAEAPDEAEATTPAETG